MGGLITPIGGGGGGGATPVKLFVTTGGQTDNGDSIDYQFDLDVVEDDSEAAVSAVFGIQLEIYDSINGGFFDVSQIEMADTAGSTSVSCGTGCTMTQFLVTTDGNGQYRGSIRLQKSAGLDVTVDARVAVFISVNAAYTPASTNFLSSFLVLSGVDFTIGSNADLESELNGAGYDHGAYGVYDDGTTRRALRWFAFNGVSGAGRIVPDDVWSQGTLTYIGGYTGTEGSTPAGWTTIGNPVAYPGTYLDFDSSGSPSTRALNLAIPSGTYSQIYYCQFQRIPSMTNDEGVGALLREGAYMNTCGRMDDGLGAQLQTEDSAVTASIIPAGTRLTARENDADFAWIEGWLYDAAGNSGRMYFDHILQSESVGGLDNVSAGQLRVGIADPNGRARVWSKMFDCWGIV